ncbi:MAG: hypothetical protein VX272_00495 [Planctomycetota bacterium]|nr:hypothetical protein [Planctomycetota bacterium]
MRVLHCVAVLFVLFAVRASFAQENCSTVLVADGVDFSMLKGGAVGSDLEPLNLDEDGDGIPDRPNEPSPDENGAPTLGWTLEDFDASDWEVAPSGFGYGDRLDIIGTVLDDMEESYVSVYLRHTFEIENLAGINSMAFNMDYDDSFVAYINGVEVARRNLEGSPPPFNELAGTNHESTGAFESIPLLDIDSLEEGENILAIQVHNTTWSSSDLHLRIEVIANPDDGLECPTGMACSQDGITGEIILNWTNQEGGYEAIQVWRNGEMIEENIGGDQELYVDDSPLSGEITYAIVAVDPAAACAECEPIECTMIIFDEADILIAPGDEWSFLTGAAGGPDPEWLEEDFDDFDWEVGPTGIGYGDGDDATVIEDMRNSYVAIYARKVVQLELAAIEALVLSCAVDDGFVAYFNGEEIGRFNVAEGEVNNDTTAITANPQGEPVDADYVPVEIAVPGDLLVEGNNVIAISVHNATLNSSDLTFVPTLIQIPSGKGGGPGPGVGDLFLRGDVDDNGFVNLTDAVSLLLYLFQQGNEPSCLDSTDIDDNGFLNLTDGVSLLNHLFRAGPAPQPPGFLECGEDPTEDTLGDCTSSDCAEEG